MAADGTARGEAQGIISTRLADGSPARPGDLPTRPTEPAAEAAPPASTGSGSRLSDAPTMVGGDSGASPAATGSGTGSVTRLGRTRTNASLSPDAQQLDLKLQVSRPSVLAGLGRNPDRIPPGVRKLIDEHGTEGRYAIERQLAQGGMGAVLLIRDGDFRRPAAMKVMLSQHARSRDALERFLAEAQVTAQLEHPNIVPIHDLGMMEDGTVYFTMKFIEGESLGSVAKRLRSEDPAVAVRAAAEWGDERILLTFLKVLDGLGYAHDRGVVHRDLKPDNIMLGGHGEVLVVDWGIAKVLGREDPGPGPAVVQLRGEDAHSLTRDGTVMGTIYYMPPEQARGELASVGPRSDIYAIGATLYELLARQRPVSGATGADIIAKIVNGELVPIRQVRPDLSDDLAAIVMKALAFAPEQRYATCAAFAADIRSHLAGQAVVARRRNLVERLGAWLQRHRRRLAAAGLAAALAGGGIAGTVWYDQRRQRLAAEAALAEARAAASSGDWSRALARASAAGDRSEALALVGRAEAEIGRAAAAAAARGIAARLVAEGEAAAAAGIWQEARDKAQASLASALLPEAQALLVRATAELADTARLERRRRAESRQAEGDARLARAAALPLADPALPEAIAVAREAYAQSAAEGEALPGVDAALAALGALAARAEAARAAAADQSRAAAAAAAATAALDEGRIDAAAEAIATARRLDPGDGRIAALGALIERRLLAREDERAAAAAREQARRTAAEALAAARRAATAMAEAAAAHARHAAEAERLESALKAEPAERKPALFAARTAAQAARAAVAEQWALAEGAARGALDALAGEPQHADAQAARELLVELYRGRLDDARRAGALPEIAAFTNLLRRLGDEPGRGSGRLAVSGPSGLRVTVRRLELDGMGRLVARDPPVSELTLPGEAELPLGRYELRGGDEVASVAIDGGPLALRWAPERTPALPGVRLRWVPQPEGGFWLAEDEVTVRQYAQFLADAAIAAEVRAAWRAWVADSSAGTHLALLPRQGGGPDEAVWQPRASADRLTLLTWTPVEAALAEPVRGVSRGDAEAYCRWLARRTGAAIRLPTLAQWRFAATGGDRQRIHPWGPGFDHGMATSALPPRAGPPAVGSAGDDRGPFGHRDLAGSVREWVADAGLAYDARIAGGAWTDEDPARLRTDAVESLPATAAFSAIGFRILVEP